MATRKGNIKPPVEDFEEPGQEELDLYDFLEEIGASISTIDVFRVDRDGKRPHIDRVTMDAIREDVYSYLRQFGPGRYWLQFKSADRSIRRSRTIDVAMADKVSGVPAVNGTQSAPDHLQYLREQLAQQQTLLLALIGNLGGNKGPDLSFLAGVLKPPDMAPVVALMTAVLNRKEPEGGGLAMAKQIVELSRDLQPDNSGREDTLWSVVKDVGGKVVSTLDKHLPPQLPLGPGEQQALPPAPAPRPGNLPPGVTVHSSTATGGPAVSVTPANFQDWLRSALAQLKVKAAQGKDVELQVEYIMENTDEPQFAAIAGAIQQGATFDQLLQFDPEIAQSTVLKVWFKALYDGLHTEIFNPVDTSGEGGHADNPGNNAGPGATGPAPGGDTPTS
jgi:hypothetical protein